VFTPSASRPAARIAAAVLLAAAGALSVASAPAAQPGRAGSLHHAMPVFRPALVQHAPPRWTGGGPPAYTSPGGGVHAVNPGFNNPTVLRPSLPLNNPGPLRPNFPRHNPDVVNEQGLPGNGAGNGVPAVSTAPSLTNPAQPVNPVPPQGEIGSAQALSSPVIRPLLKPPPGGFLQSRPAFPVVQQNGRFWPLHRDHKAIWFHGHRHFFVPAALLGAILLGDSYWYPDGYVSMDGPACTGYTADGCQLEWRMVDFEDDGGGAPQCVQYCPQAGPPPEQAASLPPPLALTQSGACQTTIFSEPNFGGNSAPTGDSQPILSSTGWRNEIASVVVAAGTWDFFADENFGGESLRLTPGTYPRLPPEWTQHIGSFMCVEPGPPPA
jgi:hypothetical protein